MCQTFTLLTMLSLTYYLMFWGTKGIQLGRISLIQSPSPEKETAEEYLTDSCESPVQSEAGEADPEASGGSPL